MKILDNIRRLIGRGGAKNRTGAKDPILDRDREGRPLREKEILSFLQEEYTRRRQERLPLERQWTLNANFYAGNQQCGINPASGEIQPYLPLWDYEEQGVYNRIAPLIETRLAGLRALSCGMVVRPRTNEAEDCEKSSIATALLRYTQAEVDFDTKKNVMLLLSELYGTSFLLSRWDPDAGEEYGALPDEEEEEAEEAPARITREGGVAVSVLSPFEVFPADLSVSEVGDQESVLLAEVLSVEQIADLYGVRVKGGDSDVYALHTVAGGGISGQAGAILATESQRADNCATVLTYMERPSARHPGGVLAIAAGEKLVWYSDLPYDGIPLVALKCKEAAGQFFGRSSICDLIPLQRAYNGVKNRIHDYIRAVAANPLLVPEGSIPDIAEFATHGLPPGEIVEYNAERGKPEPLSPAPLPAELRYECDRLASDMEYTAGVSQLMVVGKTPSGVTSGTAIENLRQIDNTRLALSGENLRGAVRRLSLVWLSLYRRYVSGYRTLMIAGENEAAGVLAFSAGDLNSCDVVPECENELIHSAEEQRQRFLEALRLGLFLDENGRLPRAVKSRARQILQAGSEGDLVDCDELQICAAERENAALTTGKEPQIGLFDDHELHAEAHKKFLLQARFSYLKEKKPALAAAFERHLFEHLLRAAKGGVAHGEKTPS